MDAREEPGYPGFSGPAIGRTPPAEPDWSDAPAHAILRPSRTDPRAASAWQPRRLVT